MANKNKVYKTYDTIAEWFDEHRSRDLFEKYYLDLTISHLVTGAQILDVGCGMGEPIARYFIEKGYVVTGIDGSHKLIDLAKKRFPLNTFMVADMRELNLPKKFDCIIAWDSFFHLPPSDQRKMFSIFAAHLNPNGMLLFTSGPDAGEVWGDNGGQMLYHASLSPDEYKELLAAHGFELITYKIEDEQCHGHTVWLARYSR